MRERPIIFSGPMVRAILEDRKFQTRRVIKPAPADMVAFIGKDNKPIWEYGWCSHERVISKHILCPYGKPGDKLWVRECFSKCTGCNAGSGVIYRADGVPNAHRWKPSIHMPRWASRILLEITQVRVERVQEISEADAIAEGVERNCSSWNKAGHDLCPGCLAFGKCQSADEFTHNGLGECDFAVTAKEAYQYLWDSINSKRGFGWESNPWVWAISFKRVQP